jgi:thioredoxin
MKNIALFFALVLMPFFISCTDTQGSEKNGKETEAVFSNGDDGNNSEVKPEHLTYDTFIKKVWNFKKHPQQWVYEGDVPCVIDFYADWCRPCKMVAPIMEELAQKYDGKLKVYKIDVDKERELASVFQVRSIPSVLFVPKEGKPMMQVGAMQRDDYFKIVEEELLKQKQ